MIVGIDFDNTIVSYDWIFHQEAVERGLIPPTVAPFKSTVRNHLRREGKENLWIELQGYVYGPGIAGADSFPGVKEFLKHCLENRIKTCIVSHKTKFPSDKALSYNLHQSAMAWLTANGFLDELQTGLSLENVFFLGTKQSKIEQIRKMQCDIFIDDLPEFLGEKGFPDSVFKVLFDPNQVHTSENRFHSISSWTEAIDLVMAKKNEVPI